MTNKPQFEDYQLQQLFARGEITADGVGISREYPKMLFRKGTTTEHMLNDKPLPLKVDGVDIRTMQVDSSEQEDAALAEGWFLNPSLKKTKEQEQAEEIARLRAQVASKPADPIADGSASYADAAIKRGPGRPPKALTEGQNNG